MSGTTWSKFFWSDWESDPALRLCSLAAQGLWMRMLCIAAKHDPIGYVAVAGRSLGVTDLAQLTGASETEVGALMADLERNGVFSRDRLQRVYSRRMVKDARASAEARKNGKLGGNPNLRKDGGNSPGDNPQDKGPLKPHKPQASTKVGGHKSPPNLSGRPEAEGLKNRPSAWSGPAEVREAFVIELGEDWTATYLDPCQWRDVPERGVIPATGVARQQLTRTARGLLAQLGVYVLERAA